MQPTVLSAQEAGTASDQTLVEEDESTRASADENESVRASADENESVRALVRENESVRALVRENESVRALVRETVTRRVDEPPTIDGRLDDACWGGAQPSTNFMLRTGDGDVPSQQTIVRVCHDDTHIYVAFECLEDRMDALSAAVAVRDAGELDEDDTVTFAFDTFLDGRSSYAFACNALGTEMDLHVSECGRSVDDGWDAVWSVATKRSEDRWTAEFAIPFSGLRYSGAEEMIWGVDFWRSERPHREVSSWSNRDGGTLDPSHYGRLVGLSGIETSRGIEVLPFALMKYDASNLYDYPLEPGGSGWDVHPDLGLDVEFAPVSTTTVSLTLNPDFAQIEADENRINLTGNELFLDERRPFFSENADVFRMPLPLLYTRRMEDIVFGGKITGKSGGGSYGVLYVRSEDVPRGDYGDALTDTLGRLLTAETNDYGAMIYRQDVMENATMGAYVGVREGDETYSRVGALTGGVDVFDNLRLIGLAARTSNSDSTSDDDAYSLVWSYDSPNVNSGGEIEYIGEQFDPGIGFILPTRRNRAGFNGHFWKRHERDGALIDHFDTTCWGGRYENLDGEVVEYWGGGEFTVRFNDDTLVGIEADRAYDALNYADNPDRMTGSIYVVTNSVVWTGYVASVEFGDYHDSRLTLGRLGGRLQPVEPLTMEFNIRAVFLREHQDVDWWVGDVKTNYRLSSTMFLRNILQGTHFREKHEGDDSMDSRYDLSLLYGWEFSPGSMLYVAYDQALVNDGGGTELLEPVLTVKTSYLFTL
jgi:hypothetical protein